MIKILFAGGADRWDQYETVLPRVLETHGITADIALDHPAAEVDYIIYAPNPALEDFTPYTRVKAVMSLWAGVDQIVQNPTLTMPLTRMVDDGLAEGMREWVTGHVLRHHLGMDAHIVNPGNAWAPVTPPLARDRRVSILGLGALGQACARALVQLNFDVCGWSRTPKTLDGVACFAGEDGLKRALERADIAVLLLPQTAATQNLLNAERIGWMPQGAVILNPGRGPLIDEAALIAALDQGALGHATLDVFRTEPLPAQHPFWAHPKVTVTPHIASETRPETASEVIATNISRIERGDTPLYLVDRNAGY